MGQFTLSVVIPCYNEVTTIEEIVRQVRAVQLDIAREIVIVDDGSTDGTRDVLKRIESLPDVRVFYHERNMGKGAAVRTAIQHVAGDAVLIQDADLEYDPRDYPLLLRPLLEGRSKVVYGSRFLGGPRRAMLFWHMIANKLLTLATNILYDTILSDMETCYKLFAMDVVRSIPLRARGFELEPEITAKVLKRGYRIYEVPISYAGREYHEGKKIKGGDAFKAMWALLKYRFVD
jgi:glycosyltransferase involved in cell wall biosynthesis